LIEHLLEIEAVMLMDLDKPPATGIATDDDRVTVRDIVLGPSRSHAGTREQHERLDRLGGAKHATHSREVTYIEDVHAGDLEKSPAFTLDM
jgi:hypothetical protein